jgi:hypothetical protein
MLVDTDVWVRRPRAGARLPLTADLTVEGPGMPNIPARLCNIDYAGCRVRCPEFLGIGSAVTLTFSRLEPVEAKVVWRLGADTGLAS